MEHRLLPPVSLDESTFERLVRQLDSPARFAAGQMIIDLEQVRFVDPYGMVGLLVLARFLPERALGCAAGNHPHRPLGGHSLHCRSRTRAGPDDSVPEPAL